MHASAHAHSASPAAHPLIVIAGIQGLIRRFEDGQVHASNGQQRLEDHDDDRRGVDVQRATLGQVEAVLQGHRVARRDAKEDET